MTAETVRRLRSALLIVAVGTTMTSIPAIAQQKGALTGTLSDPQGARVSNNTVELRWNEVGSNANRHERRAKKHIMTSTDSAGRFELKLYPGDYDVFAYRDGFAPVCTVVFIESSETKNIELRFPSYAPQQNIDRAN